ncbi:MAG: DUF6585 family protein [Cyanobacteria bacterium J06592_8]
MKTNIPKYHPQLGQHLGSYRKPLMKDIRFTIGIALATPALFFLSLMLWAFLAGNITTDQSALIILFGLLGTGVLIGGILIGLALITHSRSQELYKGGLLLTQGSQLKIIPFEQIITVWQKQINVSFDHENSSLDFAFALLGRLRNVEGKRLYQYRIETKEQETVISEIQEIGNYTLEVLRQRELPRLKAIYKQGDDIQLGELTLNQYGIKYKKKELPWPQLRTIRINRDYKLIIESQKSLIFLPWLSIKAERIPNLPLLWPILTELQTQLGFQLYGNLETANLSPYSL